MSTIFYFLVRVYFFFKYRLRSMRLVLFLKKSFHYSYLRYFGVETEYGRVTLVGLPIIKKRKNSKIVLGRDVTLVSHSRGNPAGVNHPVILATLAEGAVIQVGEGVAMSGSSICAAKKIIIGKHTGLGSNSHVYDTDFHAIDALRKRQKGGLRAAKSRPVEIGQNVWVAANVLILKGVTIGNGAVIGAGSVVRKDVPDNGLAIGNPAEVIRMLGDEKDE